MPRYDVTFEADTLAGVPGLWVRPSSWQETEAILHFHAGWFTLGSATAFRHLVGHLAVPAGAQAFIADYRRAPEFPFPAATDDAFSCYRALAHKGIRRIALTGDSAGGNLALGLAARVVGDSATADAVLVAVAAFSPVTDLTLSGTTYETRADADPFFTRSQVAELVRAYLASADPSQPLATPLNAALGGMPPVRIHVGGDEVLLDDSIRYIDRATAAGIDARLDVWLGMPHGFTASVGKLKAAGQALDAAGAFLARQLRGDART